MKKIAQWIITAIILPLLKDILIQFGKTLLKYMLDLTKQKMHKWKDAEAQKAETEEEKNIIIKKWNDRMEDIESMKSTIDINVDKIVEEAMKKSDQKVIELQNQDDKKLIEA